MMFMSACVVTTQLTITLTAALIGYLAGKWGRKPLLLIGFGVLPLRGVLYCLTHHVGWLIAIQILDGIGAGIFGVVSLLVIADLTRSTGRFNITSGAIATGVGIGASLSQVIAGAIVHHFSYRIGFLFLATIAAAAVAMLGMFLPETRESKKLTKSKGIEGGRACFAICSHIARSSNVAERKVAIRQFVLRHTPHNRIIRQNYAGCGTSPIYPALLGLVLPLLLYFWTKKKEQL